MFEGSKIALITGANKGIGIEIARQLGVQGIIILAGVRDQARGETAVQQFHRGHRCSPRCDQLGHHRCSGSIYRPDVRKIGHPDE